MSEIKGTHSWPKIYALGSKEVLDILKYEVDVTEKIDGSQIGFGVVDGELVIRSKGALINPVMPPKMFRSAVSYITSIKDELNPEFFYYGECLETPRHNKLKYERVPMHNVALYGIREGGIFLDYLSIADEALRLGFDVVPLLHEVYDESVSPEDLDEMLKNTKSFLGGEIEGIVISSPYSMPGEREPFMQAKLVRQEFKEVKARGNRTPAAKGSIEETVQEAFAAFCTEARWDKAIQHLKEDGKIVGSNTDIGPIIKEIQKDVMEEEGEYVKEMLWTLYRKRFLTAVVDGFPRYYQERLLAAVKDAA